MMPYYGQPVGTDWEEVGFGFNKGVITGLLRQELGFDGIVCTDWGLLNDSSVFGEPHEAAGVLAQRRSLTPLTNHSLPPLSGRPKLYVQGVDAETAAAYEDVVTDPLDADVAVLRLSTPYEHRANKFESFFHSGTLAFPEPELKEILRLLDTVPTLVGITLERPAVIPEIAERAAALIADFGAGDAAVEASRPDVPNDTVDPVFAVGSGLRI
ncbi:hypothetical protein [Streptomyces sp. NPDC059009]|uniref:hypothetical protein n=1 Tax=Streptomyces sp. NPDC059009 TaxID=3346694 RepID=UPI0036969571